MSELMNRWHVVAVPNDESKIAGRLEAHYLAREVVPMQTTHGETVFVCGAVGESLRVFDRARDLGDIPTCEGCKAAIRELVAARIAEMKAARP